MEDFRRRYTYYEKKLFGTINEYWASAIKFIRAKEFFAELLGTFVLVLIGDAAIAQVVTSGGDAGGFLTVNIGYGIGLVVALYVSIGVSGGHLNPAVTLAMALRGKLCWLKVIPYWVAQYLGAFLAAAVVYGVYVDAIHHFETLQSVSACNHTLSDYKTLCTGGIFATYPKEFLSLGAGFFDQVVGTFILLLGIFAICDSSNSEPQAGMKPLAIGLVLLVVGTSFGFNCGYAVNPARDLSPRIFTAIAGWGKDAFVCSHCSIRHWWWVPIVAPMVGGAVAGFVYWFFVEAHHTPKGSGPTYHRVSADDSEDEGLLTHSKVSQDEVN